MESMVTNKIVNLIKQNCNSEEIALESNFLNLGYNSYNFIKLIVDIEEEFDIEFDIENLHYNNFETIKDFVEYIGSFKKTD